MTHVMLDLETLGKKPGCVVLAVGAYAFDPLAGYERNTFYRKIDVFSSLMTGLAIDPETIEWWRGQSAEAQAEISGGDRFSPLKTVSAFNDWFRSLDENASVWAKSPQFDCEIWQHVADLVGLGVPWNFRNVRDVRTVIAVSGIDEKVVQKPDGNIKHHALFDCELQAMQVRAAYEAITRPAIAKIEARP